MRQLKIQINYLQLQFSWANVAGFCLFFKSPSKAFIFLEFKLSGIQVAVDEFYDFPS